MRRGKRGKFLCALSVLSSVSSVVSAFASKLRGQKIKREQKKEKF